MIGDKDDIIRVLNRFNSLETGRQQWENHWEEIALNLIPRYSSTFQTRISEGEKKNQYVFDSTGEIALERFASILDSVLTPAGKKWHTLSTGNVELDKDEDVKLWLYEVTNILFKERYNPNTGFQSQNYERWLGLGAFGTSAMYIDFKDGGLRYRNIHLNDLVIGDNHQGVINTVFRRMEMTAGEAIRMFDPKMLPDKIIATDGKPKDSMDKFKFVHCVVPNYNIEPDKLDYRGKKFLCYYLEMESKQLVDTVNGYDDMPYSVARYSVSPHEVYGRSPAMTALPDIKMLNQMSKTDIRVSHNAVNPPLAVYDDGVLGGALNLNLVPGGINPGGVTKDGRLLIQPINSGIRVDISEAKMEVRRANIREVFMNTLFQILVDNPRMTATEALIRAQEKGMLLNPTISRQQSMTLGVQIEREVALLLENGKLPDMPQKIIDNQGKYEVVYNSPLNLMQRSDELMGVQKTLEALIPLAQIKEDVFDSIDIDKVAELTAEISGMPPVVMRSMEEVQKIREGRETAQQEQAEVEQGQIAADTVEKLAKANSYETAET